MTVTTQCPSDKMLRRYSIGDYTDGEGARVEAHLAQCETCEEMLVKFDDAEDSLLRHMPLATAAAGVGEEPVWLQRLVGGIAKEGPAVDRQPETCEAQEVAGQDLGAYEVTGILGRGGMGIVYAATHRRLGRPVALKVVSPKLLVTRDARRRFDRETRVLGTLNHPGIVSATDAGTVGGAAYLVMEQIDGVNLANLVRQVGPLRIDEACAIGRHIASALSAAHQAGAVHRDVKPSNAMIDRQGKIKLLDFGLAHLSTALTTQTETSLGKLLGTLDYMAPEQASGGDAGPAADIYGLGATLFFLLAGRPPRENKRGESLIGQLRRTADQPADALASYRADTPAQLNELLARLLALKPAERPKSAQQVAEELSAFCGTNTDQRLEQLAANLPPTLLDHSAEMIDQSLSWLLGNKPPNQQAICPVPIAAGNGSFGWKRLFVIACGAAFFALLLGVIVLELQTPEGTVRIESEVSNVTLDFVDEKDRVSGIEIDRGENTTELRTGIYRVQFNSPQPSIVVTPNEFQVDEDQQVTVRVQRSQEEVMEADFESVDDRNEDALRDRSIYAGKTEAQWQMIFDAERNPIQKIEAGKALVMLTDTLAPSEKLNRVLKVAGELIRDGWGDDPGDYLLDFLGGRVSKARRMRWPDGFGNLSDAWFHFDQLCESRVEGIPAASLCKDLLQVINEEAEKPKVVMAVSLLFDYSIRKKLEDSGTIESVLANTWQIDDPVHACAMVAAAALYYKHGSEPAKQTFAAAYSRLGRRLQTGDARDLQLQIDWLGRVESEKIAVQRPSLAAEMAFAMLRDEPNKVLREVLYVQPLDSTTEEPMVLSDHEFDRARKRYETYWKHWLPLCADHLGDQATVMEAERAVLATLNTALRVRPKDHDEAVVSRLGADFQKQWDRRLSASSDGMKPSIDLSEPFEDNDSIEQKTTSLELLTLMLHCGGELPEELASASEEIEQFIRLCGIEHKEYDDYQALRRFQGLLVERPIAVIRSAIEADLPENLSPIEAAGLVSPIGLTNEAGPRIDPLVTLAVCERIAGEDATIDRRIAGLLRLLQPEFSLPLKRMLERGTASSAVAERMLTQLRDKAIDLTLFNAVARFLPGEAKDQAMFIEANPDSLLAMLDDYNADTREDRATKFDPPVNDLELDKLISAIQNAAKRYRGLGHHDIADALEASIEQQRLIDGLKYTGEVSGTAYRSKEDGEVIFKQYLPSIFLHQRGTTAINIVLSDIELRWSRDGWSSSDWGDIHPVLDGNWKLIEVSKSGKELDADELDQWRRSHPWWNSMTIRKNSVLILTGVDRPNKFWIELSYDEALPKIELSVDASSEDVDDTLYGVFMTSASVDFTNLTLVVDTDHVDSFRTDGTHATKLQFKRVAGGFKDESSAESTSDRSGNSEPSSDANPNSLVGILNQHNDRTREVRQREFDPPIPDLTIERLRDAFKDGVRRNRKTGEDAIAEALQWAVENDRLPDRLVYAGTGGGEARDADDGIVFRQYTFMLNYEVTPQSLKAVILPEAELRWSKHGWSSPDWGDIQPPLTGEWELSEIEEDGEAIDSEAFDAWTVAHPEWSEIAVGDNQWIRLGEVTNENRRLKLDYEAGPGGVLLIIDNQTVLHEARFMTNTFIDNTQLKLCVNVDGGSPPKTFKTEGTHAVKLTYQRRGKSDQATMTEKPKAAAQRDNKLQEARETVEHPPAPEPKKDVDTDPSTPRVTLMFKTESGKPAQGVSVRLDQTGVKGQQPVWAEGLSTSSGVAIDRILPFGYYRLKVKTADGWSTSIKDIAVEFERGLSTAIVVPEPGRRAELIIRNLPDLMKLDSLQQLRFGDLRDYLTSNNLRRYSGYSPQRTPEPDQPAGDYETFPSAANGIETIGLKFRFHVARRLSHPLSTDDEELVDWTWLSDDLDGGSFIISDNVLRNVTSINTFVANLSEKRLFFELPSDRHRLGLLKLTLGNDRPLPLRLNVPEGTAWLLWTGYVAKPSAKVLESINGLAPEDKKQIWLSENLINGSQWARQLATHDWFYEKISETYYGHVLRRVRPLGPGDQLVVEFAAHKPKSDSP